MFSIFNRDRSRSNSGTGNELPILVPFSKSDKTGLQSRSGGQERSSKHPRSYSSGDVEADPALFEPTGKTTTTSPLRTRSRTVSNPALVPTSSLFSIGVDNKEPTNGESRDSSKDTEDAEYEVKEYEEGDELLDYEFESDEDELSLSYDDLR
jgi:hypothetical protein